MGTSDPPNVSRTLVSLKLPDVADTVLPALMFAAAVSDLPIPTPPAKVAEPVDDDDESAVPLTNNVLVVTDVVLVIEAADSVPDADALDTLTVPRVVRPVALSVPDMESEDPVIDPRVDVPVVDSVPDMDTFDAFTVFNVDVPATPRAAENVADVPVKAPSVDVPAENDPDIVEVLALMVVSVVTPLTLNVPEREPDVAVNAAIVVLPMTLSVLENVPDVPDSVDTVVEPADRDPLNEPEPADKTPVTVRLVRDPRLVICV